MTRRAMANSSVDLYNNSYAKYGLEVYRQVRIDTYGEDLGQTSWATTEESNEIPVLLGLSAAASVLEIGFGSGRYALQIAERIPCSVTGIEVNANAVRTAQDMARSAAFGSRLQFMECDASRQLPFRSDTFDAAFANDVMCHIRERAHVLREIFRVLRPGARFLFSDALVIGGIISHEEIAARSSIGYYLFSPPGENERLLAEAGFQVLEARDTTVNAVAIATRWRDSRERWKNELISAEGEANFHGTQRFLDAVHTLTSEGRLRRFLYLAGKPAN